MCIRDRKKHVIDENRVIFLRGVLAAFASSRTVVTYDEIRRLCRLNKELVGEYLGLARRPLRDAEQPDFCSIVVNDSGIPGKEYFSDGELDAVAWAKMLHRSHDFWADRRSMDNSTFEGEWDDLPAVPGLDGIAADDD